MSLVTFGIHWSTAFSSALIMACGPVFTLLILHWHRPRAAHARAGGGVALACAGVLVFLSDKLLGRQWAATGGDLMMLFAASLFSYYTVMTKPLIQRHGGVRRDGLCHGAGSPLLVLLALPAGWQAPWDDDGRAIWAGLLWAALVSAFLGWLVWGWVNERARRRPHRAAAIPDAAGGRRGGVAGHRRAFHRGQDRRRRRHAGRRRAGAVRHPDANDPVREAPAQVD